MEAGDVGGMSAAVGCDVAPSITLQPASLDSAGRHTPLRLISECRQLLYTTYINHPLSCTLTPVYWQIGDHSIRIHIAIQTAHAHATFSLTRVAIAYTSLVLICEYSVRNPMGGDQVAHLRRAYVLLAIFTSIRKGCTDGMVDPSDLPAQTVFNDHSLSTNMRVIVGWTHQLMV